MNDKFDNVENIMWQDAGPPKKGLKGKLGANLNWMMQNERISSFG